jgi:hypothetical protein
MQSNLVTTIVQKLWQNSSSLLEFITLHHRSYKPVNVTKVDSKLIINMYVIFFISVIIIKC